MRPVKSMPSRDSVSGELFQSHGCRPVACELLGRPPERPGPNTTPVCQGRLVRYRAEVRGVGSEEGEHHWNDESCGVCLLTTCATT